MVWFVHEVTTTTFLILINTKKCSISCCFCFRRSFCSSVSSCSAQSQPLSFPSLFHFPSLLLPDIESCVCGACIYLFDSVCGCFLSLFFIVFVQQHTAVINYEISNGFPIHSEHTQRQCVPSSVCVSVQTESVQRNRREMNSLVRSECVCA